MNKNVIALFAPMLFWVISANAENPSLGAATQFNIPKQRADVALTEFARQSNMTVIVPYDKVVGIETAELKGRHSLVDAAISLLEGTSLQLSFSNSGQLFIRTDEDVKGNPFMLQKNKLSSAVLLAMSSLAGAQSLAQETSAGALEEVLVTGVRASLERAMDIKRDSSGVVDAISAEDMGKFPDTNLAESLQRITGVSISRENGEGSKVTVRGFGEDYNMITLNGRTMPAADAPLTTEANGRGFDFAQLASELVRGVEVYKTGRAEVASGGIGATINMTTARPLDNPGLNMSFGVKGVHDTTNRAGDDLTPEVSGIVSWTDDSDTVGVGLALSHQQRDSGATGALVSQWNTREWVDHDTDLDSAMSVVADENGQRDITNAPQEGELYATPSDLRYTLANRERTRTNGQLVLQYAPSEQMTTTLDYTFAEKVTEQHTSQQSIYFLQNADRVVFDTGEAVATPIIYSEDVSQTAGKDTSIEQQYSNQKNELGSLGLNVDYWVNDRLNLKFDFHDSTSKSSPDSNWGGSLVTAGMGARVTGNQKIDYSADLPIFVIDRIADCGPAMNCNGTYDINDVGTQRLFKNLSQQETDVTQFRFDGDWETDEGTLSFGLESRSTESSTQFSRLGEIQGDYGIQFPGDVPNDYLHEVDFASEFDDYSTTSPELGPMFNTAWAGDALQLARWGASEYGYELTPAPTLRTNRLVEEDILSGYVQFELNGQFGDIPYNLLTGFRYEETEVTSIAAIAIPETVVWESNNDFSLEFGSDMNNLSESAKYDHLLPSLDLSLDLTDELVARMSYSKTIARPTYNHLGAGVDVGAPNRPTVEGFVSATATKGNPGLVPLESNNFDLSLEWYYDDSSYASAGFFEKRVDNFVGTEPVREPHFDLRDPTVGPRAQAARAAIEARDDHDGTVDETELFTMVVAMENNLDYDTLDTDQVEVDYDITPTNNDPLYEFSTDTPVNNESAKIYGFEFATQHFFGASGFGVQANYTIVRGDVSFDNAGDPTEAQFALSGLSDTANLVAVYEDYGWSARLAYNWRDKYLANTNYYNNNPEWVEEYFQIDLNVSYEINDNFQVFFEGLNLTEENFRSHGRSPRQVWSVEDLGARYQIGARYTF